MPNRLLREGILMSATMDRLTAEQERLFYRLIVLCDDYGRFHAGATVLRSRCFPRRVDDITDAAMLSWLAGLQEVGLVRTYTANGEPYLEVQKWYDRPRAQKSKFPAPPVVTGQERFTVAESPEKGADHSRTPSAPEASSILAPVHQPTKAERSIGFPMLACYAIATGRKPKQLSREDVAAAEALTEQERNPDELSAVLEWMAKSPYHGDPSRLTSVEKNWGKYDTERVDGCKCGNVRNMRPEPERVHVDHTGQRTA